MAEVRYYLEGETCQQFPIMIKSFFPLVVYRPFVNIRSGNSLL